MEKEKVTQLIAGRIIDEFRKHSNTINDWNTIAAAKIYLQWIEGTNKWISVKNELPKEIIEFVLLFNADAPKYNQCVYQGVWFLQDSKFKSDTNHNLLGTVTHWMPLPGKPISTTEE